MLVAILAVGIFVVYNYFSQPANPPVNNPPVVVTPDDPTVGNPTNPNNVFYDDYGVYHNNLIGISLVVPEGWTLEESRGYPDEVLTGIYGKGDYVVFWIDRYPSNDMNDLMDKLDSQLALYTYSDDPVVVEVIYTEDVIIKDRTWLHISFTVTSSDGVVSLVELYAIDMPNNRGLFLYALMAWPTDDAYQDYHNDGLLDGMQILKDLEFTK